MVRSGDTLSGIALSLDISMADLIALNGITDPNKIKPGQVLKLP
ncbi:MAG: LysM domain-containing protein [Candidatus Aquidulcis sp.]|nr:MAG: LysM domain-containing protein [Candidatus Aquidulcis sp.]RLT58393.1 MAG: LysM domain-containing protein [Candidatus Aquidulcis sp.]